MLNTSFYVSQSAPGPRGYLPTPAQSVQAPRDVFRFVAEYCLGLESIDRARSLRSCLALLLGLANTHPTLESSERQVLTAQTLELLDFLDSLHEASLLYRAHTQSDLLHG
jgi:hypothetical protein